MAKLFDQIKAFFTKEEPLKSGFFTYQSSAEAETHYRLHLRIEPDGSGILIINASTVLHLNQTAVEMVKSMMQELPFDQAIKHLQKRYNVPQLPLEADYITLQNKIKALINTPDLDPVMNLDIESELPGAQLNAPYRLDCAITYLLDSGQEVNFAPQDRVTSELTTAQWLQVIQKTFDAGIPHIIFTGGEPTLRSDLVELLQHCEDLGMVTGLLSDGKRLADKEYLESLLMAGLDHLMLTFDYEDEILWQSLAMILDEDIYTTVHLTLKPGIDLTPIIERLAGLNVNAISLSTSEKTLQPELNKLRDLITIHQIALVWDLPVPYSAFNPIEMELQQGEIISGAAYRHLYIEPDGDVLPAQGINQVMGNMLTNDWDAIWNMRRGKPE